MVQNQRNGVDGECWGAIVGVWVALASGCAGEEARMRHHYLHQQSTPHHHSTQDEADPLRVNRAPAPSSHLGAAQ